MLDHDLVRQKMKLTKGERRKEKMKDGKKQGTDDRRLDGGRTNTGVIGRLG